MRHFIVAIFLLFFNALQAQQVTLLNVSYDVSRELFRDINRAFIKDYKAKTNKKVSIRQSHNGSSKQARAVADGLQADVVTMNQSSDIEFLVEHQRIAANWADVFPNNSTPYYSTILFLVRKGNPKNIHDWDDLVRPDISVIIPNPKTSGNGRYGYLSAWLYAEKNYADPALQKQFMQKLFKNVPILDTGSRASTTNFIRRNLGDVLITFESEVMQINKTFSRDHFDIVTPSISIEVSHPVALVKPIANQKDQHELATTYLNFLFSDKGQQIIANNYLRPINPDIFKQHQQKFSTLEIVPLSHLGEWKDIFKQHFGHNGLLDQIYLR